MLSSAGVNAGPGIGEGQGGTQRAAGKT